MQPDVQQLKLFQETVWDYYTQHGRSQLPWRRPDSQGLFDPYTIMVSELMLQQTQVARVVPKYHAFIERFPDVRSLAAATLGDVLRVWQGLGYNRRAKFLWLAAQQIAELASFPDTTAELVKLPGIGKNTAGAILAYSYNRPVLFIETNVRSVYLHHFFSGQADINDAQIVELVGQTLDRENSREWYWALMDYGSYLKATVGNPNHASKHFSKQSTFHGSRRQVRGAIIRLLGEGGYTVPQLKTILDDERLEVVLTELVAEQLIREKDGNYSLD